MVKADSRSGGAGRKRRRPLRPGHEVKPSPTADILGAILAELDTGFTALVDVAKDVRSKYKTWSIRPPLDRLRQTRFVTKLDEWAAKMRVAIEQLEIAQERSTSLPTPADGNPDERAVRRMLSGLKALKTVELLRELLADLQSLADRARQPLSAEGARKLWSDYAEFIRKLDSCFKELREIKKCIRVLAHQRVGTLKARNPNPDLVARGFVFDNPVLVRGETATHGLDKLYKAVDKLATDLGKGVTTQNQLTEDAGASGGSYIDQHEDILLAMSYFDQYISTFMAVLKEDDCKEIINDHPNKELNIIGTKVQEVLSQLSDGTAVLRSWITAIRHRESADYRIPKELPGKLDKVVQDLATNQKRVQSMLARYPGKPVSAATAQSIARIASSDPDCRAILSFLCSDVDEKGGKYTVKEISDAVHISEQKARRKLRNMNDDLPGVLDIDEGKRSEAHKSPPYLYAILPTCRDAVRNGLDLDSSE